MVELNALQVLKLKLIPERWFGWIDAADPVPEQDRAALAERDEFIRRTICVRDPANVVVDKLFGTELGEYLVDTLWGGTRKLPRPGI